MTKKKQKLFNVSTEIEIVVLASDPSEAQKIAARLNRSDLSVRDPADWVARSMTHMPGDWDGKCLPFGHDPHQRTLTDLIAAGFAPEYSAALASALSRPR